MAVRDAVLCRYRTTGGAVGGGEGRCGLDWEKYVAIDPRYLRPTEVDYLQGDASKARNTLGWKPKVDFRELVQMMVRDDVELAKREKMLKEAGYGPDKPVTAKISRSRSGSRITKPVRSRGFRLARAV